MSSASSTSAPVGRRPNRVPIWLTAASVFVLVAGVLAFLIAYDVGGIRNTADVNNPKPSNQPAQVVKKEATVPVTKAATNIAIQFLDTAPARKNLALSYKLVTNDIRQGMTLKQWMTGNIPVTYYPVWGKGAGYSPYQVAWSWKNELMLKILLTPKKGEGLKPMQFWIGVKRPNAAAPWKVYYFQPYWFPPRPTIKD